MTGRQEKPLYGFPKQEDEAKNHEILDTLRKMFAVVVFTRPTGETYYTFQATLEEAVEIARIVGVKVVPMVSKRG